jgi:GTPase SAR1 family protein
MRGEALQAYLSRVEEVRLQLESQGGSPAVRGSTASFLARIQRRLMRPPRIAIVGETNTGKTSLANMLLGKELLITDIINNTRAPILIRYADSVALSTVAPDGTRTRVSSETSAPLSIAHSDSLELGLPLPVLKRLEIIDTPGVSTLEENHDRMAYVCRQADMAIWCTLATQAWRSSECQLWHQVCRRTRSRSLLAVTHADALTTQDRTRVLGRLEHEAGPAFAGLGMVDLGGATGDAASAELAAAFMLKIDSALDEIARQRVSGARQAVLEFSRRLGSKALGGPAGEFRAAS